MQVNEKVIISCGAKVFSDVRVIKVKKLAGNKGGRLAVKVFTRVV